MLFVLCPLLCFFFSPSFFLLPCNSWSMCLRNTDTAGQGDLQVAEIVSFWVSIGLLRINQRPTSVFAKGRLETNHYNNVQVITPEEHLESPATPVLSPGQSALLRPSY
ncbi:hypothetical protein CISG_02656 [Coccidioides immitis RMSCC 3703]|uniref:Secreted protein n=2 Tax=Coccidioides immitis TaxID=5501 RepID=A0A0J8R8D4_COCIT|nr:hypothetical protein CIRG_09065 [Coccidioides immitis RMSCC 2394]KMU81279.1 hypothetical protein CISG_02656 [Coccidioides immitis RMSCC 3703]